jgi:cytidylate kinase
MSDRIIITLDGPAGSGKSTVARELARALGYAYLDTGAMYRAVTLAVLRKKIDCTNASRVIETLPDLTIDIRYDGGIQKTLLNGEDVSEAIRTPDVSRNVSAIAAIPEVRQHLVAQQQRMGRDGGYVVDGRDAGTVIFPNAAMKFFLTASVKERARRRQLELAAQQTSLSLEQMIDEIERRDRLDSSRDVSPLRKAPDAIEIDNTSLTVNDQVEWIVERFRERYRVSS